MDDQDALAGNFDAIARYGVDEGSEGWNHSIHYHDFLLSHLPQRREAALDVGCGTGVFTRALAPLFARVEGVDLSVQSVRLARQRSCGHANVSYCQGEFMSTPYQESGYDCIVSIATLHHLPLDTALAKMNQLLRPGGALLVLDLYREATITDYAVSAVAVPANWFLSRRHGEKPASDELRNAWKEHERFDRYPTLREVRRSCRSLLSGATVRRHLLWRYSVVWEKPSAAAG
jgi:ubiquinone/menaquinone biosynthesis C-methylase UbiE